MQISIFLPRNGEAQGPRPTNRLSQGPRPTNRLGERLLYLFPFGTRHNNRIHHAV